MSEAKSIISKGLFLSIILTVQSVNVRQKDSVLNKGVWVKTGENLLDKSGFGDFLFKPNSVNVDDMFQDDFYSFGNNNLQDPPFVPNFIERTKRSPSIQENGYPKSVKGCNAKDCKVKNVESKPNIQSKFTPKLKQKGSILAVYPYDVAVLLGNAKNNNKILVEEVIDHKPIQQDVVNETKPTNKAFEVIMANEILIDDIDSKVNTTILPKRSMNKDYESEVIKKIEINEGLDHTNNANSIFDNKASWHYNTPSQNVNVYKVVPKGEEQAAISESGLLKLLAILTKTFKKIMKQHTEIKKMHSEMFAGKEDIDKSVRLLVKKFNDFEAKYSDLKNHNDKLKEVQKKLEGREEYFKTKETEMAHNLKDFENQQKKFLAQQRQFYNIQKLMLSQNEKINIKQGLIAKTQGDISRRQNNFARILKKAKQLYMDRQNPKSQSKISKINVTEHSVLIATEKPIATESVKIDLFSIPSKDSLRLENQDHLILKEKHDHLVDDLVYKYYFNNTFIDNLMKNQVLSGHGSKYMTRNVKSKRNEVKNMKSTILMPVDNALDSKVESKVENRRAKRWIRRHSKGKRRKHHKAIPEYEMKDEKQSHPNENRNLIDSPVGYNAAATGKNNIGDTPSVKPLNLAENHVDPFTAMAANFCNQVGQNGNEIIMGWCMEKVLRRLQNIETIPMAATNQQPTTQATTTTATSTTTTTEQSKNTSTTPSVAVTYTSTTAVPSSTKQPPIFFPDNDELESNLKQYELKPDLEGNVYYEGSLHASEVLGHTDSDGYSDVMPGLDSNSRIQMDPLLYDFHALRQASVKRINDKIKKSRGIV